MRKAVIPALLLALPLGAFAADLEEAVDARQGYYSLLGFEMHSLVAMAKGEVEYDAEKAKGHAADMLTLTKYDAAGLFPPGTSKADMPGKTRALPAIWEDPESVQEKGAAFVAAVKDLNEVAGEGRGQLGKAVQDLGGTCKGCHDDYRAEDF